MGRYTFGRFWLVTLNGKTQYCVEASTSANAVFAALRKDEYNAESVDLEETGEITFELVRRPKGWSKKKFCEFYNKQNRI